MSTRKRVKAERNLYKQIWKLSSVALKSFTNKRLKLALRHRFSEQGFAIPIAIGLGLIMILIATMMIARSQGEQVTASAQKATARSLAVAEGGISRTLAKLNQSNPDVSSLLKRTYDPNGLLGSALNEWTTSNMPPCATTSNLLSGTIGNSSYEQGKRISNAIDKRT